MRKITKIILLVIISNILFLFISQYSIANNKWIYYNQKKPFKRLTNAFKDLNADFHITLDCEDVSNKQLYVWQTYEHKRLLKAFKDLQKRHIPIAAEEISEKDLYLWQTHEHKRLINAFSDLEYYE